MGVGAMGLYPSGALGGTRQRLDPVFDSPKDRLGMEHQGILTVAGVFTWRLRSF